MCIVALVKRAIGAQSNLLVSCSKAGHNNMRFAGVVATVDLEEAVKGVDIAVMVGGFPRKAGMERKDVMSKNVSIYQSQAAALEKGANKGVKVLGRFESLTHKVNQSYLLGENFWAKTVIRSRRADSRSRTWDLSHPKQES